MKTITLGQSTLQVPRIAVGCMRLNTIPRQEAELLIHSALENGANFFDHSDVYGQKAGDCESIFGRLIKPSLRETVILQSKCGIVKNAGIYNLSKENILKSVDASLKRLNTDYLDILLLHRPDALIEPEEVAEAFDLLEHSGKVRWFGVSNQNSYQLQLLRKYVKQTIVTNQLQLSIAHPYLIANGMSTNTDSYFSPDRDGGILDYCRLHDITIQAWSPFQYGFFGGIFLNKERFPELNAGLERIAEAHGTNSTAIATTWILRHPARMQVISGTTKPSRLKDMCRAVDIQITREEWYELYHLGVQLFPK